MELCFLGKHAKYRLKLYPRVSLCFIFSRHSLSPCQLCCFFFPFIVIIVSVLSPVTRLFHFMPPCLCSLTLLHAERLLCARGLSCSCSFLHSSQRACARFFWLHCSKVARVISFSIWHLCTFLRICPDTDILTITKRFCSLLMQSYVKHHRRDKGLKIICVVCSHVIVRTSPGVDSHVHTTL